MQWRRGEDSLAYRALSARLTERLFSRGVNTQLLDILEFGGESPQTMRAWCCAFRYCPDPLGIDTAEVLDKLELD